MTTEELENLRAKIRTGNELSLKITAANELIKAINCLRFSRDKENLLGNNIKSLIVDNTANFDEVYFLGDKFASELLKEINIDAVTNETLKNISVLVRAKKAELEEEFENYKI